MENVSYQQDFYGWLQQNAQFIREGNFSAVDAENVAEELESMARSEKRELVSRFTVVLTHLLKWQFQPARRSTSWRNSIYFQRIDIHQLFADSPSLKHDIDRKVSLAYKKALLTAEVETGLDKRTFPADCPFTLEQILDDDFFPEQQNDDSTTN